ncbi:unnamed protein product [Amoebophrya sp. A120]|nr:unnamed protein product [Amoebophrya sp. A120]|eukprot:GSA120T00022393001.1
MSSSPAPGAPPPPNPLHAEAKSRLLNRIQKRQKIEDQERLLQQKEKAFDGTTARIKPTQRENMLHDLLNPGQQEEKTAFEQLRSDLNRCRTILEKRKQEEDQLLEMERKTRTSTRNSTGGQAGTSSSSRAFGGSSNIKGGKQAGATSGQQPFNSGAKIPITTDHTNILQTCTKLLQKTENFVDQIEKQENKKRLDLQVKHEREIEQLYEVTEKLKHWYEELDNEVQERDDHAEELFAKSKIPASSSPVLNEIRSYVRKVFSDLEQVFVSEDIVGATKDSILQREKAVEMRINEIHDLMQEKVDAVLATLEGNLTDQWQSALRDSYSEFDRQRVGPHPIKDNRQYLQKSREVRELHAEHLALLPIAQDLMDVEKEFRFIDFLDKKDTPQDTQPDPQSEDANNNSDYVNRYARMQSLDEMKKQVVENYELLFQKLQKVLDYVKQKMQQLNDQFFDDDGEDGQDTTTTERKKQEKKQLEQAEAEIASVFHFRDEHLLLIEDLRDLIDEKLTAKEKVLLPSLESQKTLMKHLTKASQVLYQKVDLFQTEYHGMQAYFEQKFKNRQRDLVTHVSHLEQKLELLHADKASSNKLFFQRCLSENFLRYPFETQTTYLALMARVTELEMHLQSIVNKGFPELAVDNEYSEKLLVGNLKKKELLRILIDRIHELEDEKILEKIKFKTHVAGEEYLTKPTAENPHGVLFSALDHPEAEEERKNQQNKSTSEKIKQEESFKERRKLEKMKHENFILIVSEKIEKKIKELKKQKFIRSDHAMNNNSIDDGETNDEISVADTEDSVVQMKIIQKQAVRKVKKEIEERKLMEEEHADPSTLLDKHERTRQRRLDLDIENLPSFGNHEDARHLLDWDLDVANSMLTADGKKKLRLNKKLKIADPANTMLNLDNFIGNNAEFLDDFLVDDIEDDEGDDLDSCLANELDADPSSLAFKQAVKLRDGDAKKSVLMNPIPEAEMIDDISFGEGMSQGEVNDHMIVNYGKASRGGSSSSSSTAKAAAGRGHRISRTSTGAGGPAKNNKPKPPNFYNANNNQAFLFRSEREMQEALDRDLAKDFERSSSSSDNHSLSSFHPIPDHQHELVKMGEMHRSARFSEEETMKFIRDLKEAQFSGVGVSPVLSSNTRPFAFFAEPPSRSKKSGLISSGGSSPGGSSSAPVEYQFKMITTPSPAAPGGNKFVQQKQPASKTKAAPSTTTSAGQGQGQQPRAAPPPGQEVEHPLKIPPNALSRKSVIHLNHVLNKHQQMLQKGTISGGIEQDDQSVPQAETSRMIDVVLPKLDESMQILDLLRQISTTGMEHLRGSSPGTISTTRLQSPTSATTPSEQHDLKINLLVQQLEQILNLFKDSWLQLDKDATNTHFTLHELYTAYKQELKKSNKRLEIAMTQLYRKNVIERMCGYVEELYFNWQVRVQKRREAKYLRSQLAMQLDHCRMLNSKDTYFTNWRQVCKMQNSSMALLHYYATNRFSSQKNHYLMVTVFLLWSSFAKKQKYEIQFDDLTQSQKLESESWKKLCEEISEDRNQLATKCAYLQDVLSATTAAATGEREGQVRRELMMSASRGGGSLSPTSRSPGGGVNSAHDKHDDEVENKHKLHHLHANKESRMFNMSLQHLSNQENTVDIKPASPDDVTQINSVAEGMALLNLVRGHHVGKGDAAASSSSSAGPGRGGARASSSTGGLSITDRNTITNKRIRSTNLSPTKVAQDLVGGPDNGVSSPLSPNSRAKIGADFVHENTGIRLTVEKSEEEQLQNDLELLLQGFLAGTMKEQQQTDPETYQTLISEYAKQIRDGKVLNLPKNLQNFLETKPKLLEKVMQKVVTKEQEEGKSSSYPFGTVSTTATGTSNNNPRSTAKSSIMDLHNVNAKSFDDIDLSQAAEMDLLGTNTNKSTSTGGNVEDLQLDKFALLEKHEKDAIQKKLKKQAIHEIHAHDEEVHGKRGRGFIAPTSELSQIFAIKNAAKQVDMGGTSTQGMLSSTDPHVSVLDGSKDSLDQFGREDNAGSRSVSPVSPNRRGSTSVERSRNEPASPSQAIKSSNKFAIGASQEDGNYNRASSPDARGGSTASSLAKVMKARHDQPSQLSLLNLAQKQSGVTLELLKFWRALQLYREIFNVFYGSAKNQVEVEKNFVTGAQPKIMSGVYGILEKDLHSVDNSQGLLIPRGEFVYIERVYTSTTNPVTRTIVCLSHVNSATHHFDEGLETSLEELHESLLDIRYHLNGTPAEFYAQSFPQTANQPQTIQKNLVNFQNLVQDYSREAYFVRAMDFEQETNAVKMTEWSKLQRVLTYAVPDRVANDNGTTSSSGGTRSNSTIKQITASNILENAQDLAGLVSDLFVAYAEGETQKQDSKETRKEYCDYLQEASPEFLYHVQDLIIILRAATYACEVGKSEQFIQNPMLYQKLQDAHSENTTINQDNIKPPSDVFPEVFLLTEVLNSCAAHVKHTAIRYLIETASSFYGGNGDGANDDFGTSRKSSSKGSFGSSQKVKKLHLPQVQDTHEAVLVHAFGFISFHFRKAVDLELRPITGLESEVIDRLGTVSQLLREVSQFARGTAIKQLPKGKFEITTINRIGVGQPEGSAAGATSSMTGSFESLSASERQQIVQNRQSLSRPSLKPEDVYVKENRRSSSSSKEMKEGNQNSREQIKPVSTVFDFVGKEVQLKKRGTGPRSSARKSSSSSGSASLSASSTNQQQQQEQKRETVKSPSVSDLKSRFEQKKTTGSPDLKKSSSPSRVSRQSVTANKKPSPRRSSSGGRNKSARASTSNTRKSTASSKPRTSHMDLLTRMQANIDRRLAEQQRQSGSGAAGPLGGTVGSDNTMLFYPEKRGGSSVASSSVAPSPFDDVEKRRNLEDYQAHIKLSPSSSASSPGYSSPELHHNYRRGYRYNSGQQHHQVDKNFQTSIPDQMIREQLDALQARAVPGVVSKSKLSNLLDSTETRESNHYRENNQQQHETSHLPGRDHHQPHHPSGVTTPGAGRIMRVSLGRGGGGAGSSRASPVDQSSVSNGNNGVITNLSRTSSHNTAPAWVHKFPPEKDHEDTASMKEKAGVENPLPEKRPQERITRKQMKKK